MTTAQTSIPSNGRALWSVTLPAIGIAAAAGPANTNVATALIATISHERPRRPTFPACDPPGQLCGREESLTEGEVAIADECRGMVTGR